MFSDEILIECFVLNKDLKMLCVRTFILLAGYFCFNLHYNEVTCHVQPLTSYRPELEALLYDAKTKGDRTKQTGEPIFWRFLQTYVSKFADQYSKTVTSMTTSQKTFLTDVLHDIRENIDTARSRFKRQAEHKTIVRKEIRMLNETERADYFRAINSLKMDTRLPPNLFDFMANLHRGEISKAYSGPGFPGWHRIFLYMYEFFLQLHISSVTLPYWASVLDNEMTDPTQSVIWSNAFMGSPGSGPFSNWTQINPEMVYERNIGNGNGSLYNWDNLRQIISQKRNAQILWPTSHPDANLEYIHDGVHMWVGASMSGLNSAARDPIFYMTYAFSDLIWQAFRNKQRRNNINPATDYSFNSTHNGFSAEHAPNTTLGFFNKDIFEHRFRQIDGLSMFFDKLIQYAPIPSCSKGYPNCGSPYLYCETSGKPRCVSRTAMAVDAFPKQSVQAAGADQREDTATRVKRSPITPLKLTYVKLLRRLLIPGTGII